MSPQFDRALNGALFERQAGVGGANQPDQVRSNLYAATPHMLLELSTAGGAAIARPLSMGFTPIVGVIVFLFR